ncbi:LysR substrate-binding domain-containing protein [Celeribacter indicus]|uniref:LysR family transcriptional regulator n=1 Tax=Celeribacter indicus TaxID=1208324 RepID=A0A0B5DTG8_9RHOB|nr:LysR substrate-binding domain-containing protein [Celeribacter indicus]AJE46723.1 LysR family transcriptional regulator [Celeribacter indicus]SDX04845.1 transcriptional regulator, LysR family [Celeribacter indicus]
MRQLTMRQVEAFRAVMRLGSMTRAAEFLQISQPAVSRLMADMQESLGYTLFRRTRHGTIPTPEARRLRDEVGSLFSGLEELNRRVFAIRDLEIGELRIGAISIYGNGLLPQILSRFLGDHPGVTVTLEVEEHDRIVDRVHSGKIEFGIVSLPAFTGDLDVELLSAEPAVCVMPPDHPLAGKRVVEPADLADVPFISFPRSSTTRFQIDRIFDRLRVPRRLVVEAATHEAVCNFVAAGVGVSIISPFSPYLRDSDRLVARPFHPTLMREIGLLAQPNRTSLVGARFRKHVDEYFRTAVRLPMGAGDAPDPARARRS